MNKELQSNRDSKERKDLTKLKQEMETYNAQIVDLNEKAASFKRELEDERKMLDNEKIKCKEFSDEINKLKRLKNEFQRKHKESESKLQDVVSKQCKDLDAINEEREKW